MSEKNLKNNQTKEKEHVHDFKIEGSFKSKKRMRPLNAFHDEFYVDTTVYQRRCKECGFYELHEI